MISVWCNTKPSEPEWVMPHALPAKSQQLQPNTIKIHFKRRLSLVVQLWLQMWFKKKIIFSLSPLTWTQSSWAESTNYLVVLLKYIFWGMLSSHLWQQTFVGSTKISLHLEPNPWIHTYFTIFFVVMHSYQIS